jgi:hypothetical protein
MRAVRVWDWDVRRERRVERVDRRAWERERWRVRWEVVVWRMVEGREGIWRWR